MKPKRLWSKELGFIPCSGTLVGGSAFTSVDFAPEDDAMYRLIGAIVIQAACDYAGGWRSNASMRRSAGKFLFESGLMSQLRHIETRISR